MNHYGRMTPLGLKIGIRVRVERGALQGVEAIQVQFRKTWRVMVDIESLQRSIIAELDLAGVVPLDSIDNIT